MFLVLQKWIHFLLYKPQLDRVFSVYDVIDNLLGCGDLSDNCTTWQRLLLEVPWFRLMLNIFVVYQVKRLCLGRRKVSEVLICRSWVCWFGQSGAARIPFALSWYGTFGIIENRGKHKMRFSSSPL